MPSNNSIFPLLSSTEQEQLNDKKNVHDSLSLNKESFDKDRWEIMFNDSSSRSEFIIDKHVHDMPRYCNKMCKIIELDIMQNDSWAKQGASEANDFCDNVFERIGSLRKENTTRPVKQRDLNDLFKTLKDQGFSSSEWTVPTQVREMSHFLQLPVLDNSEHSWLLGNAAALNSAEQYFFRVFVEMNRLRSEVSMFGSKHITQREMHVMIGFSEHGLLMLCQQKCLLNSVAENLTTLHNLLSNFSSTAEILPTRQSMLTNRLSDFELQLKSSLEIFSQVLLLMKQSLLLVDDNAKKANIRDLTVFVDSSLLRLNSSHNNRSGRRGGT